MRIALEFTIAVNGGYGILSNGLRKGLVKAGHEIVEDNPEIVFCYGTPDVVVRARDRYKNVPLVYYTVFESSRYPEPWIKTIKEQDITLLLTATEYTKWTLSRDGLEAKILHHGVDDRWSYKPRRDDGVFTFIHWNAFEWRKGWDIVLGAFMEEFGEDEPVKLILKARETDNAKYLYQRGTNSLGIKNVEEIIGHLSDEAMVDMMERADCGVFPVKGEGWFINSMECVAQGIPVIMPNRMGMAEQWGVGYIDLGIKGYINASPRYPGYMIMPSLEDCKKKMRWAYEHQDECKDLGLIGSKQVHERFNWDRIINDLERYLILAKKDYVSKK